MLDCQIDGLSGHDSFMYNNIIRKRAMI